MLLGLKPCDTVIFYMSKFIRNKLVEGRKKSLKDQYKEQNG